MHVIELSGYTCSGKNTAGEMIKQACPDINIKILDMTERILIPEAVKRGMPITRESLRSLYVKMGISAYERLHQLAVEGGTGVLITPNGRLLATRNYFTSLGYPYTMGWVEASEETRFSRYLRREKEGEKTIATIEDLRKIDDEDSRLTDMGKIKSGNHFDLVIDNNVDGLGNLRHELQRLNGTLLPSSIRC
ncbi:MAG: hypothetical protein HYS62_02620 [Candidatus Aenigmarchaeota archaeon]|nr:hypothetical protein [Candidatus Aenigmarchaeota archaeon]